MRWSTGKVFIFRSKLLVSKGNQNGYLLKPEQSRYKDDEVGFGVPLPSLFDIGGGGEGGGRGGEGGKQGGGVKLILKIKSTNID